MMTMNSKMITFLTGTIKFTGMFNPILMEINGLDVDISEIIYEFMRKHNRKPAKVIADREGFTLKIMDHDRVLNFEQEKDEHGDIQKFGISIEVPDGGWGWTNTLLELEYLFTALIGRNAILEIDGTEGESLTIRLDGFNDDVKSVYFTHGNMANLPKNWTHKETCKPGTGDACIFLTAGSNGFACAKYSSMARDLIYRHANGNMNATRVGTCKLAGRWEELLDMNKEEATEEATA